MFGAYMYMLGTYMYMLGTYMYVRRLVHASLG